MYSAFEYCFGHFLVLYVNVAVKPTHFGTNCDRLYPGPC